MTWQTSKGTILDVAPSNVPIDSHEFESALLSDFQLDFLMNPIKRIQLQMWLDFQPYPLNLIFKNEVSSIFQNLQ